MTFETEIERLRKQNRKLKVTVFVLMTVMIAGGAISSLFAANQLQRARSASRIAQEAMVEAEMARDKAAVARTRAIYEAERAEAKLAEAERRNATP